MIHRTLLGAFVPLTWDEYEVEVAFPKEGWEEQDDSARRLRFDRFRDEFGFPLVEGTQELFASGSTSGSSITSVDVLRISITSTITEAADPPMTYDQLVAEMHGVADRVMESLFDALRSRGSQPRMGLTGTPHTSISWRLLDLDNKVRYPHPAISGGMIRVVRPESVLRDIESAKVLLDSLQTPVTLAESLLADALFFEEEHFPQAVAVAVLLAAIACEVYAKEVIRRTAGPKLELAELLMTKHRDFTFAARSLFLGCHGRCERAVTESCRRRTRKGCRQAVRDPQQGRA